MLLLTLLVMPAALWAGVPSSPSLGMAEGRCRAGEPGPAFLVTVTGLRDRKGTMKAELYPANDDDFLQDDNILINEGKTFRRVVVDVPDTGAVQLCIRAPGPGAYGLTILHDRNSDRRFDKGYDGDGLGFGGNPSSLGPFKPRIAIGRVVAGNGITPVNVVLLYRTGLLSFGRLK
jgi:uncharacterized protein (DUF2141 family)